MYYYDINYDKYNFNFAECRKSARDGYDVALFNLGCCYENGRHTQKDSKLASLCFIKIASIIGANDLYRTQIFHRSNSDNKSADNNGKTFSINEKAQDWFLRNGREFDYFAKSYLGFYYIFYNTKGLAINDECLQRGVAYLIDCAKGN